MLPGFIPIFSTKSLSTPVSIGSNWAGNTATSFSMTTSAASPAGVLLVVAVATTCSTTLNINSITDSAGNTYTQAVGVYNATSNLRVDIWYCANAKALASSSTITANFSNTSGGAHNAISAVYVPGALTAGPLDKTAHTEYLSGTTLSSGSSGTLSTSRQAVFGLCYAYASTAQSINEGSGFTTITANTATTPVNAAYRFAYQMVNSSAAVNYQPTANTAMIGGHSDLATFKGN